MSRTFTRDAVLSDDREVEVEFTISPYRPATGPSYACGGEPAEGGEVEIGAIRFEGVDIIDSVSDDERERLETEIFEDPPEEDDGPDFEPWEDR